MILSLHEPDRLYILVYLSLDKGSRQFVMFGLSTDESIPERDHIVHACCSKRVLIIDVKGNHIFKVTAFGLLELHEVSPSVNLGLHEKGNATLPTGRHEPVVARVSEKTKL
jgi:hypothetical protein